MSTHLSPYSSSSSSSSTTQPNWTPKSLNRDCWDNILQFMGGRVIENAQCIALVHRRWNADIDEMRQLARNNLFTPYLNEGYSRADVARWAASLSPRSFGLRLADRTAYTPPSSTRQLETGNNTTDTATVTPPSVTFPPIPLPRNLSSLFDAVRNNCQKN